VCLTIPISNRTKKAFRSMRAGEGGCGRGGGLNCFPEFVYHASLPHVTRHTSHVTRHTSHVTRHTSQIVLPFFNSLFAPPSPSPPSDPRSRTAARECCSLAAAVVGCCGGCGSVFVASAAVPLLVMEVVRSRMLLLLITSFCSCRCLSCEACNQG